MVVGNALVLRSVCSDEVAAVAGGDELFVSRGIPTKWVGLLAESIAKRSFKCMQDVPGNGVYKCYCAVHAEFYH